MSSSIKLYGVVRSVALALLTFQLPALAACGSDSGEREPAVGAATAPIRINDRSNDSEVKRMRSMWQYLSNFLDSKAFQKECGSGLPGATPTCLSATTVDGDATSTTPAG